jgi:hypothetical protein
MVLPLVELNAADLETIAQECGVDISALYNRIGLKGGGNVSTTARSGGLYPDLFLGLADKKNRKRYITRHPKLEDASDAAAKVWAARFAFWLRPLCER